MFIASVASNDEHNRRNVVYYRPAKISSVDSGVCNQGV